MQWKVRIVISAVSIHVGQIVDPDDTAHRICCGAHRSLALSIFDLSNQVNHLFIYF